MPLIFTPELQQQAEPTRTKHYRRLVHRWAIDERHEGLRGQLERAAALIPAKQRGRVLGQLTGKSSSDEQVRAAAGSLLLAKTLGDFGWSVEFEPAHAGGTPDLRITKDAADFVIEVRRVPGPKSNPTDEAIARIQDALASITTTTPFSIRAAHVPGNASLKPLAAFVRQLLSQSPTSQRRKEEHVDSPKSGRDRSIDLTDRLNDALRSHRHLRGERVFCVEGKARLTPGVMEGVLNHATKKAGLRRVGWHVLRHTSCSHLAMTGADAKTIQEFAGHSTLTMTLRYMHLAPGHKREAITRLERHAQTLTQRGHLMGISGGVTGAAI